MPPSRRRRPKAREEERIRSRWFEGVDSPEEGSRSDVAVTGVAHARRYPSRIRNLTSVWTDDSV